MYFCAVEIFANKRIDNGMELLELILIYSFPSLEFWERIRAIWKSSANSVCDKPSLKAI